MALIDKLKAIGDAIRAKTGKSEKLSLDDMVTEIDAIEGGGDVDITELSPFILKDTISSVNSRILEIDCLKGGFLPSGNSYVNLFNGLGILTSIKNFSIPSNILNIGSMFWQCYFKSAPMDFEELASQVGNITSASSSFARMFHADYKDVSLRNFKWTKCTNLTNVLYDNAEATMDLSGWEFPASTQPPGVYWNRSLTTLTIDGWDFSNVTNFGNNPNWLAQNYKLSSILGTFTGLGNNMATIPFNALNYQTATPHVGFDTDTVTRIINALVTKTDGGTYTLAFTAATEANVTEAQIAAALEKGWTITFG